MTTALGNTMRISHSQQLSRLLLICGCYLLFFVPLSWGQQDTTSFGEVTIIGIHSKIEKTNAFDRNRIRELAPVDLGTLLKRTSGATIADYGGIGSLKSLSMRGLGSSHTGLVINGTGISMAQQAQIDFSKIQVDNIENVRIFLSPARSVKLPTSAQMQGSSIAVETFERTFTQKKLSLRLNTIIGSFGQQEIFGAAKFNKNNTFLAISGNLASYEGDFHYHLPYIEDSSMKRKNNSNLNYNLNLGAGKRWRTLNTRHQLRLFAKINAIERELPGAIILYNSSNDEELLTDQTMVGSDYSLYQKNLKFRVFTSYEKHTLRYFDPSYLNLQGFIDNRYTNHTFQSGANVNWKLKQLTVGAGTDIKNENLMSTRNLGNPNRISNVSMLATDYKCKFFSLDGALYTHFVQDINESVQIKNNYYRLNPQFSFRTTDQFMENFQLNAWYKHSSRAPSFNELYYRQIGNTDLVPEESQQLNLGYEWILAFEKFEINVNGNLFHNWVNNKIVALPTQNMFVWSIQNVGKVVARGSDLTMNLSIPVSNTLSISASSGLTYQSVIDESSRNSPTYGHQIANTPTWMNNSDLQIDWKSFQFGISSLYMGSRYSLNQNIPSNLLEDYLVLDLTMSYKLNLFKKHQLSFQGGVRNFADKQYYHINYFVMPGRNYFIKLLYEL